MRARSLTLILAALLWTCLTSLVCAQGNYGKFWRSYSELGLRGGDVFETGQANLFLPLHQTEVSMLFTDLRGNWTDGRSSHGNFGLAFRHMLIHDWVFGVHGAYDIRHSPYDNNFHQATLGLEMLHPNWGARWNGYLPGEGAKLLPNRNATTLVGDKLFIQQAAERAYSGLDFELESRLWAHYGSSDNSGRLWHFFDWELWGSIGAYNFDNDAPGFGSMTGPRARLELRIFDLPIAGPDSRLVFAGQYEDDDVRGDVSWASMMVRIPFGHGNTRRRTRLRGANRRMVAPINRNTEIVSVVGQNSLEPAAFTRSGQEISRVVTVDANTADINAELLAATANSLVIVDGNAGTILPPGTLNVLAGQTVMGGGSRLGVVGVNSGATAVFNAPGARPLIDSVANSTFSLADDSCLLGLNISNSGAGVSGVLLNNINRALIEDVVINTDGDSAFGIAVNDATQFRIGTTTITTRGQFSDGLQIFGDSDGVANELAINTTGDDAEGIHIGGTSFLGLQNSNIFTSGGGGSEGILATDDAQLGVAGSTVSVTGASTVAIVAAPGPGNNMAVALDSSIVNASSHGIVLGGGGFTAGTLDATLTQNTILAPPGLNEIDAEVNGTAILNLSAQGNSLDPLVGTIRLSRVGGTSDFNVTQAAPGQPGGIDSANGLPTTNVLIPNNTIDFMELPPLPPAP